MSKVAKDMRKVYQNTSTADLIKNKHRKQVELAKLRDFRSYWAGKDRARCAALIDQINAELEARAAQIPLF